MGFGFWILDFGLVRQRHPTDGIGPSRQSKIQNPKSKIRSEATMSTVYAIGIDFGTSNSCVTYATYYEDMNGRLEGTPVHRPEALTFQHKDTIPTVVFLGDGQD